MPRLFVAVELPGAVKDELARAAEQLRARIANASWPPRENLHLTLAFLGSVDEARVVAISDGLASAVSELVDFTTTLTELGAFPSKRRARVVWAGLADAAGGLRGLADAVGTTLEPVGFEREKRAFQPHVTIARLRHQGPVDLDGVQIAPMRFPVERITLFESTLGRPSARYDAVATFPFRRA